MTSARAAVHACARRARRVPTPERGRHDHGGVRRRHPGGLRLRRGAHRRGPIGRGQVRARRASSPPRSPSPREPPGLPRGEGGHDAGGGDGDGRARGRPPRGPPRARGGPVGAGSGDRPDPVRRRRPRGGSRRCPGRHRRRGHGRGVEGRSCRCVGRHGDERCAGDRHGDGADRHAWPVWFRWGCGRVPARRPSGSRRRARGDGPARALAAGHGSRSRQLRPVRARGRGGPGARRARAGARFGRAHPNHPVALCLDLRRALC